MLKLILDRNLTQYSLLSEETIASALRKIVENRKAIICGIDANGVVEGLFTNGDFLRWSIDQLNVDLQQPISTLLNREFVFASPNDSSTKISTLLEQVNYIPLLDERRRLIAVARRRDRAVRIGSYLLEDDSPTFVIAEIGLNHNGSLAIAKQLVDAVVSSGAYCAKFQMRTMRALYVNNGNANDVRENLGAQYTLDLLARFQLSSDEMAQVFDYCEKRGIMPLCTPWDSESLAFLEDYGMMAYKVASADLTNHDLLQVLADTGKPLICSTGMSNEDEIVEAVSLLQNRGAQYILLNCNSTYPPPFKDVHLRYMRRLQEIGECLVGHSGHERGIQIAVAAVALGAKVIEKHITLDRDMEGNDHKVSLLPDEFAAMTEGIRQVEQALGTTSERAITQGERINRSTLAKSLVINCSLRPGDLIRSEMIEVKSPGRGLQPNRKAQLVGKRATRAFSPGDFFYPSDLEVEAVQSRHYSFSRPWGLPVRYHDFKSILEKSNPDFLEFHLSYKDMDLDPHKFFDTDYDLGLTVHSPDLFAGDHLLNLAAEDESHRQRSIKELQRVIDLTRALKPHFRRTDRPFVIVSVGGFSRDGLLPIEDRPALYARVAQSLAQINAEGVELIAQTLPPFPWYFGGQLYLNLFVAPDDTAEFCKQYGYRLCFDVSHSKLACNHFHWSFSEFVNTVSPHTAHLHLVDAQGLDGEGLQIGEGDIDFSFLAKQLDLSARKASFIPEIWQGHENDGEGFWIALERLEKWF